jgi:hypothetical protein
MRRVVVTGLGIVSSIGDGADAVAQSLKSARSGIVTSPEFVEHGFRSQVWAPPAIGDWSERVDRRASRFLAAGTAWAHIAFEEALKDAGLSPDEIKDEKIGLIVGEGGPSTQVIIEAAQTTLEKGSPKRIGPFAVPKAMASGPSAVLATWFELKGINYSISSALRDPAPTVSGRPPNRSSGASRTSSLRAAARTSAGRCRTCSTPWEPCRPTSTTPRRWPAAPMTSTATVSSSPAGPASWCWKNMSAPGHAARPSMPRS